MSADNSAASRSADRDVEKLVNLMARLNLPGEGISTGELTRQLGWNHRHVRSRLLELEKLGQVYRTGERNETRWYLG
ncbi:MAG: hypothetical protein JXX28_02545 [Deltaproteobacteria bacterium]|nr:hypothetical protein [Deltaproteobacteria bacterium]